MDSNDIIKDFTPLFSHEQTAVQVPEVRQKIASLLSLLNTHNLIIDGGVELYNEKEGHKKIELADAIGYDILDNIDLAFFMRKTISEIAEEAFGKGNEIVSVSALLRDYDAEDTGNHKELEKAWLENEILIRDLIYLYSEYLYKVFLDNPYHNSAAA